MHKNYLGSYNALVINERMISMYSTKTSEPVLYISQPTFDAPKSKMQVDFFTSIKEAELPTPKEHNKSFKQYSISEKIHYLLHFPQGLPKLKCEVVTNELTYRGWLVKGNDSSILFESFNRRRDEIFVKDILDIHLISF